MEVNTLGDDFGKNEGPNTVKGRAGILDRGTAQREGNSEHLRKVSAGKRKQRAKLDQAQFCTIN